MPDRHKANPVTFRPPETDRAWLYVHAKETGESAGSILTCALTQYREGEETPGSAWRALERERVARYLDGLAELYPEDVFRPDSESKDAISGCAMRHAYRNAARMIREEMPARTAPRS